MQVVTSYSPTTNEPIACVTQASTSDYDRVVKAATSAYNDWCDVSSVFKIFHLLYL